MNRKETRGLPKGYQILPAAMSSVSDVQALDDRFRRHYCGEEGMSLSALEKEWQTPGFDLGGSVRLVYGPEGQLVGLGEVWDLSQPPVHPYLWVMVDPAVEDTGIISWLLSWGEARARKALTRVPEGVRVSLRVNVLHQQTTIRKPLISTGMKRIRQTFLMRINLDQGLTKPRWPEGIRVRGCSPEEDLQAVYRLDNLVFRDHFGYVEDTSPEGFERYQHRMTTGEAYDPGLWFLAEEGKELIGICLGRKWGYSSPDVGHIALLGVRRPWRRKGIGLALLQHAFCAFQRRGYQQVGLGVDGENLTGAVRLYLKAGMFVHNRYDKYEKELRPGEEVSVTGLTASDEKSGVQ